MKKLDHTNDSLLKSRWLLTCEIITPGNSSTSAQRVGRVKKKQLPLKPSQIMMAAKHGRGTGRKRNGAREAFVSVGPREGHHSESRKRGTMMKAAHGTPARGRWVAGNRLRCETRGKFRMIFNLLPERPFVGCESGWKNRVEPVRR